MGLPVGYVPLNEFDTSFLPDDFGKDEIIPLDSGGEVCYSCGNEADFYNVTLQASVCGEHAGIED